MNATRYIGTALLSAALLLGACASKKPEASNYSGWMNDYSNLTEFKTASGGEAMRWVDPSLKPGQYTAIMIDPIVLYPQPPVNPQVPEEVVSQMRTYLYQQVVLKAGADIKVVKQPGPGVLHLRAAITGVQTPTESFQAYEILPIAAVYGGVEAAAGQRDHITEVFLEAELSDSQSGKILAKSVRKGEGKNLPNGTAKITEAMVKPVLDNWATDVAAFINTFLK